MINKQILNTSDEAAKFATGIEGWVDRYGRFWGKDEYMARWSGCTHAMCSECGRPTPKSYTMCNDCRKKKAIERYNAKKCKQWDGNVPLYSETTHEYFLDKDNLNYYLEDHECTPESLHLVICEPIYLRQVDEDYFYNKFPKNDNIPPDVATALEDLNRIISEQEPVGWKPGKYRILLLKSSGKKLEHMNLHGEV